LRAGEAERQKQIPFGNDNKKDKGEMRGFWLRQNDDRGCLKTVVGGTTADV
jgi:hypothetical protein